MRKYFYELDGELYTSVDKLAEIETLDELISVTSRITLVIEKDGVTSFRSIALILGYDSFGVEGERYYGYYLQTATNYDGYKKEGIYGSRRELIGKDYKDVILNLLYDIFGENDIPAGFMFYENQPAYQMVLKYSGKI